MKWQGKRAQIQRTINWGLQCSQSTPERPIIYFTKVSVLCYNTVVCNLILLRCAQQCACDLAPISKLKGGSIVPRQTHPTSDKPLCAAWVFLHIGPGLWWRKGSIWGLVRLHNHMSQFLMINILLFIYIYLYFISI